MNVICPNCLKVNSIPKKDNYKKANCGACKKSFLMNKIITANASNIDKILENSDIPVIIDFWAPWCQPCKSFASIFGAICLEFPLKALFVKIDTQQEQFLASRFKIKSIPTLIVFKDTKETHRVSGAMSEESFSDFVKNSI